MLMIRFTLRRFIRGMVVLFIFLTAMFFFSQTILPYDFTAQFIQTRAQRIAMQAELGLDLPLWQQYFNWLKGLFQGNLSSYYGYTVTENIQAVLPPSLLIFVIGTVIAFVIGQWLGKVTAWRGKGPLSGTVTFAGVALYTTFPPWLAFLLAYFLTRQLAIFRNVLDPPITSLNRAIWENFRLEPHTVIYYLMLTFLGAILLQEGLNRFAVRYRGRRLPPAVNTLTTLGLTVGGWYALGFGPQAVDMVHLAGLPILIYVLLTLGETMIIMQTTMKDTMGEEYITTARAKGLPNHVVRDQHAARNALLPVFSRLIVSLPYLLTGMVIIERSVGWPGMGESMFASLYSLDMPVVMGNLLVIGMISVVARVVLEFIQLYFDPRIRERMAIRTN